MIYLSLARTSCRRFLVGGKPSIPQTRAFSNVKGFPAPRLFDYETVTSNLTVADAIESVEEAFAALAAGKVSECEREICSLKNQ